MSLIEVTTEFVARLDHPSQWTLAGELDRFTSYELTEFARSAPRPYAALFVLVHELTFLDSAGWRALRETHEIIGQHRVMRLIGATSPILHVTDILGAP